jgi:hypothetical protein
MLAMYAPRTFRQCGHGASTRTIARHLGQNFVCWGISTLAGNGWSPILSAFDHADKAAPQAVFGERSATCRRTSSTRRSQVGVFVTAALAPHVFASATSSAHGRSECSTIGM